MCLWLGHHIAAVNSPKSVQGEKMRTIIGFRCFRNVGHLQTIPGNASISTFLQVLFFSLLLASLVRATVDSSPMPARQSDLLFDPLTVLFGSNVTCDNSSDSDYKFPAETWSCYNMRIDGLRLRSYYKQKSSGHCTDDEKGMNDLGALCRQLLDAHKIKRELWAALIVKNPSCSNSEGDRMMFLKTNNSYKWDKREAGKGYVHTLRCMLMQESHEKDGN